MASQSSLYRAPFDPGSSSPIDEEIARKLLATALSCGGDDADLFYEYRAGGGLVFDDGILKSASRSVSMGLGVRVRKGEGTGFAFVERFDVESMQRACLTAARIAEGSARVDVPRMHAVPVAARYDLPQVSLDAPGVDKRAILERAAKAANDADPRVRRVEASLAEEVRELLVFSADGRMARDSQPMLRFGVRVVLESNGKRQEGSSGGGGRTTLGYFAGRSPEWHAKQAIEQASIMLEAEEAPAGQLEVVLAAGDAGILLHEAVGHGLEADFNRKGTSHYARKLGEIVASELCTVVDDATIAHGRGSINIDDEGHETGSTLLIERGRLVGYLHDDRSAKFFGVKPTGNGRRESFAAVPMPRMTNTLLTAGPHDPEEIVRSIGRGIYAKRFGGGQVDIANGDFVFSLTESYLVEDGKIGAPLKGVNLIGNGPEVMRKVVMLGNDVGVSDGVWTCGKDGQSVPVGVGCPTLKVSSMTVGGTRVG